MTNQMSRLTTAILIAIALQSHAAMAQTNLLPPVAPPSTPPEIQVPAGNVPFLKGHAESTQNYICQATDSGFTWKFLAPQATLFYQFQFFNTEISQQITTHFLSPNPIENGTPRPTW